MFVISERNNFKNRFVFVTRCQGEGLCMQDAVSVLMDFTPGQMEARGMARFVNNGISFLIYGTSKLHSSETGCIPV